MKVETKLVDGLLLLVNDNGSGTLTLVSERGNTGPVTRLLITHNVHVNVNVPIPLVHKSLDLVGTRENLVERGGGGGAEVVAAFEEELLGRTQPRLLGGGVEGGGVTAVVVVETGDDAGRGWDVDLTKHGLNITIVLGLFGERAFA
jgi:hypothetical protein